MSNVRLAPVLTGEQLEIIDRAALDILWETGVAVPHDEIREALSAHKGVTVVGETVRFEPSLVKDKVQGTTGCNEYFTPEVAGAYSPSYLDPATNAVRQANTDDLIRSIQQANALDMGVCAPVVPLDIPGPRRE